MRSEFLTRLLLAAAVAILPAAVHAQSGPYVGASVGAATVDGDFDDVDFDDDSDAYRVVGGLQLGEVFGLEAGYLKFNDFEERTEIGGVPRTVRLGADGWTLGGTVGLPISEAISIFGRGGVLVWDADVDDDGVRDALDDSSKPYYGGGAKIHFTPAFSLTGDWTRYELDRLDTDVLSLGLEFRFGA